MTTSEVTWAQPGLFPPDVLEVTLRVGVVRGADHLQWQLEVTNATDGTLEALESRPHASLSAAADELGTMVAKLRQALWTATGPF